MTYSFYIRDQGVYNFC